MRNSSHPHLPLVMLLLTALLALVSCSAPHVGHSPTHPTPTATPRPTLDDTSMYWTDGASLLALRTSDGHVRWQWTAGSTALPGGGTIRWGPGLPAVANGMVYLSTRMDKTATPTVFALDAATGGMRWHTPIAGCPEITSATAPLVVAGVIYVPTTAHQSTNLTCGATGWVYALRASDGAVLWRVPLAGEVWSTLAFTDGVLIAAHSDYPADPETDTLVGLRASDGVVLWRVSSTFGPGPGLADFTASEGMVAVTTLILAPHPPGEARYYLGVDAYRATDGHRVWSIQKDDDASYGSRPLVANGLIYAYAGAGNLYALHAADGTLAWRFHSPTPRIGPLALLANQLYFGAGPYLYALDATTGSVARKYSVLSLPSQPSPSTVYIWSRPIPLPGFVAVGFATCSGLCQGFQETLYAVDATTGNVLWTYTQSP